MVGLLPWLALALLQAVFPGAVRLLRCRGTRIAGLADVVRGPVGAGRNGLKSTVPFGGFPWGVAGFGQTDGPLLPLAQIGGAPLVSFAVTLLGFGIAALTFEIFGWWKRGGDGNTASAPPAVVLPGACICLVLIATAAVSPAVRHSGAGAPDEPSVNVAAVQGNVPQLGLDFNAQRRAVLDNHVRETLRLSEDVRAGRAPQPLFVIWPENSSDIDPLANQDAADQIAVAVEAIKAPILVGGVLAGPGYTRDNPVSTNSVIVWNPDTGPGDRHDKQIVQPFGEYLPWRSFFRHFSSYADRAGYFVPGSGNGVVDAAGVPIGVSTCWEVIFDRAPRGVGAQRRPGADGAVQQRHVRRVDERPAAGVRQAARGRAQPVRHRGGHHGDQCRHRARRTCACSHRLLRARLPRHADPAEDAAHARDAMGSSGAGPAGGRRHRGSHRRDTAQWKVRASSPAGDRRRRQSHTVRWGRHRKRNHMSGPGPAERPSQRTLVIIPTYNERENLPLIVGRVHSVLPEVHVLIVDDGSPDGTGELADELALADPDRVHVMHRASKDGLGAAYLAGFAWGLGREYSVLVEMDADGSHAPEELHRLLDAVDGGADLVIGSRYVPGGAVRNWPRRRFALSKTANTYSPGCCSASTCTTSPRATGRTGARCSRRSTSPPSIRRATASRST